MTLILDASVALAWLLDRMDLGEAAVAVNALDAIRIAPAMVPAVWYPEVANALLLAERQRAITAQDSVSFLSDLSILAIVQDPVPPPVSMVQVMQIGRIYSLTAYDAAYLELAMRHAAGLATFDRKLAAAARTAGVKVFGDSA